MMPNSLIYMKKNRPRKWPENRLKYFMDRDGLKPVDICQDIGVSDETVRRWLVGETDLNHSSMISLAKIFKCKPYELIIDKEEILKEELEYLNEQRQIFNAYKKLSDKDKITVDNAMFYEDPKKDLKKTNTA